MKQKSPSSPAKAAAARANGALGGTKNPQISRWNAVRHARNAKRLSILEGKHLPEYGEYAAMQAELVKGLGPLFPEDVFLVDKHIADAWRLRRSFRCELSETEKADNGMLSAAMPNVLRYVNSAHRQFFESYARIKELRERKHVPAPAQSSATAEHSLGGDEQTPCEPPAAAAFSKTATVSVEPLGTTPTTGLSEDALEGEEPRHSALPTPSASSEPGNGAGDNPEEAVHSAAAAEAAQPAQRSVAVSATAAVDEEEKGDSPGEG